MNVVEGEQRTIVIGRVQPVLHHLRKASSQGVNVKHLNASELKVTVRAMNFLLTDV